MLVVTRKADQRIHIGRDIVVTVVRVKGGAARIGIEAPRNVDVVRGELMEGAPAVGTAGVAEQAPAVRRLTASRPRPGGDEGAEPNSSGARTAMRRVPRSEPITEKSPQPGIGQAPLRPRIRPIIDRDPSAPR